MDPKIEVKATSEVKTHVKHTIEAVLPGKESPAITVTTYDAHSMCVDISGVGMMPSLEIGKARALHAALEKALELVDGKAMKS
jgi:hypothetical protein